MPITSPSDRAGCPTSRFSWSTILSPGASRVCSTSSSTRPRRAPRLYCRVSRRCGSTTARGPAIRSPTGAMRSRSSARFSTIRTTSVTSSTSPRATAHAREPELAIRWYRKRVELGGWVEEVWVFAVPDRRDQAATRRSLAEVLEAYLEAHRAKPDRAGPLYKVGVHYQALQHYTLAYIFFAQAMRIPYPSQDVLFIEQAIYRYLLPLEYAISAYYCGDDVAALETNNRLLLDPELPPDVVFRAEENRAFSLDRLRPKLARPAAAAARVAAIVPFADPGPLARRLHREPDRAILSRFPRRIRRRRIARRLRAQAAGRRSLPVAATRPTARPPARGERRPHCPCRARRHGAVA